MGIFSKLKRDTAVVDVRDGATIDLRDADRPVWGFPSRCPECNAFGYLDRIDMRAQVMMQHCPTCFAKWETPRSVTIVEG
ncbi:MAG: hypothetical protein JJE52_17230 [Acidimicrobiia bacterium]|nr:hypothetical protein [Acidimicrobiia bacterium]